MPTVPQVPRVAGGPGLGVLWKYLLPVAIGAALWFSPPPAGLDLKAWQMLAIFVATIAGIMTAPLPMAVVSIIGATAAALLGVSSSPTWWVRPAPTWSG